MDFMKVFDQTVREMWAYVPFFFFEIFTIWLVTAQNEPFIYLFWFLQKEGGEFEGFEGSGDWTEGKTFILLDILWRFADV